MYADQRNKSDRGHIFSVKFISLAPVEQKDLTTPAAKLSQGAIVREALELLAKEMEYGKLEKKYADFLAHISEDSVLNS